MMPDTTETVLAIAVGVLLLAFLATWPVQWWLRHRRAAAVDRAVEAERHHFHDGIEPLFTDPPPCGEVWRDEVGCYRPGPHVCVLIGGHRTHRCVCGALLITPQVGCPECGTILNAAAAHCPGSWHFANRDQLAPTFDRDDVYGLPEDRPWQAGGVVSSGQPIVREPGETFDRPPTGRPYTTDGMVTLGRNRLCRACIDHRTNGRYDQICASCRPSLVGSTEGLPSAGGTDAAR